MTARIQNTAIQPEVTTGIQHLFKAIYAGGVPPQTLELVHLCRKNMAQAGPA
jgi:hypothetical protein